MTEPSSQFDCTRLPRGPQGVLLSCSFSPNAAPENAGLSDDPDGGVPFSLTTSRPWLYASGQDEVKGVRVNSCRCKSWACRGCAFLLGKALVSRLMSRLEGCSVVMVTLTLSRDRFDTPGKALDFLKRNRSVARALSAWGESFDSDLSGRWFCKMELQRGGWPHFHVLIDLPEPMASLDLRKSMDGFWSHGFSNVSEVCGPEAVRYLAKYAAKSSAQLEDLDSLPAHGFRWTMSSRGFWDKPRKQSRLAQPRPEILSDVPPEDWDKPLSLRVMTCGASCELVVCDGLGLYWRHRLAESAEKVCYYLETQWGIDRSDSGVFHGKLGDFRAVFDELIPTEKELESVLVFLRCGSDWREGIRQKSLVPDASAGSFAG